MPTKVRWSIDAHKKGWAKANRAMLETRGEPVNFTSLLRTACLVFVGQSGKTAHHDRTTPMAAE